MSLDNSINKKEKSSGHNVALLCLAAIIFYPASLCRAQNSADWQLKRETPYSNKNHSERLCSSCAQQFIRIADDLTTAAAADTDNPKKIRQAIIFLLAADQLNPAENHIVPKLIKAIPEDTQRNYQSLMKTLLENYAEQTADLHIIRTGLSYILQTLNTREEREKFLTEQLTSIGRQNNLVYSQIATEIALLKLEKADANSALFYLSEAHSRNKYSRLAFEKLTELTGQQLHPSIYITHFKNMMTLNPLNINNALEFATEAEIAQLYDIASDAYKYTAELFTFIYPSEPLPSDIYIPWALSCYHTTRKVTQCINIAHKVRDSGRFDLFLEAIAGKAALKAGNEKQGHQILENARAKAIQSIKDNNTDESKRNASASPKPDTTILKEQKLAWFHCFVTQEPNKAIQWANKAYAKDPNSPTAAALLAYSFIMNEQMNWSDSLIEDYNSSQIAQLVLAEVQLSKDNKSAAIKNLKSAIDRDPASFVAEKAKKTLNTLGQQYIPPVDPAIIMTALKNRFGENIVPEFKTPDKLISITLKLRGRQFSYSSGFEAVLSITNKSDNPLLITDNGLFTGNIRIDANVTGDIRKQIPALITKKIMPASPIQPDRSYSVPIHLATGRLKDIMHSHPQASLTVEFTTWLDPVVTDSGRIKNGIPGLKAAKTTAVRTPVTLTKKFLQNRLDAVTTPAGRGRIQKRQAAWLFAGLLKEHQARKIGKQKLSYSYTWAQWLPKILKSALQQNLADDNWMVKLHTMAAMLNLSLDYKLTQAVSDSLNDQHWPVRLMALYLLANQQQNQFRKVLDWSGHNDSNEYVRQMAKALQQPPDVEIEPSVQSKDQPTPSASSEISPANTSNLTTNSRPWQTP